MANSRTTGGNWGNPSRKLRTVITTASDEVVLPANYTRGDETYTLEGYRSTSPELVFPNASSSGDVIRGQELRIWFVEDLGDFSEGDNSGQSCADVFLFYV